MLYWHPPFELILNEVSARLEIDIEDITNWRQRSRSLATARCICMWLAMSRGWDAVQIAKKMNVASSSTITTMANKAHFRPELQPLSRAMQDRIDAHAPEDEVRHGADRRILSVTAPYADQYTDARGNQI